MKKASRFVNNSDSSFIRPFLLPPHGRASYRTRQLFGKWRHVRESVRESLGQFLIHFQRRLGWIPGEAIGSIDAFSWEGRTHPVLHWRRHEANRLRVLRFLTNDQQHLCASPFPRCSEVLDLVQSYLIERQMSR